MFTIQVIENSTGKTAYDKKVSVGKTDQKVDLSVIAGVAKTRHDKYLLVGR
jgi:hypothetical protein